MFLEFITLASAFNFLLLAIALLFKRVPNKKSNTMLGILLFLMAIYSGLLFFHYTSIVNHNYYQLIYYAPIDTILLLLMGPCLYYYVLASLNRPFKLLTWKSLIHLVPLVPCLIFNIYFFSNSFEYRVNWLIRDFEVGSLEMILLNVMLYIQIISYLLICYSTTNKQLKIADTITIQNYLIDITWIKRFLVLNLIFMFLSAPLCFYFANERVNILIGQLAMDIQFVYLFFKSTLRSDTVMLLQHIDAEIDDSGFKIDHMVTDNYLIELDSYMQQHKPYLKEDCNIQSVSKQTGIPVHHLSIALNTRVKKNFSDFVNEYRIKEAKRILSSQQDEMVTIETIGIDCGFGSKTTFNRVFKKHSGNLTPSQFRKQYSGVQ